MFKNIFYQSLAWLFYKLGDIVCRFPFNWAYFVYQKCMNLSYAYDEKIGFKLWLEPLVNREQNL